MRGDTSDRRDPFDGNRPARALLHQGCFQLTCRCEHASARARPREPAVLTRDRPGRSPARRRGYPGGLSPSSHSLSCRYGERASTSPPTDDAPSAVRSVTPAHSTARPDTAWPPHSPTGHRRRAHDSNLLVTRGTQGDGGEEKQPALDRADPTGTAADAVQGLQTSRASGVRRPERNDGRRPVRAPALRRLRHFPHLVPTGRVYGPFRTHATRATRGAHGRPTDFGALPSGKFCVLGGDSRSCGDVGHKPPARVCRAHTPRYHHRVQGAHILGPRGWTCPPSARTPSSISVTPGTTQ